MPFFIYRVVVSFYPYFPHEAVIKILLCPQIRALAGPGAQIELLNTVRGMKVRVT